MRTRAGPTPSPPARDAILRFLKAPIQPPPPKEHEGSHGERRLEASHANPSSEESPTTWPPRVAEVWVWPAALARGGRFGGTMGGEHQTSRSAALGRGWAVSGPPRRPCGKRAGPTTHPSPACGTVAVVKRPPPASPSYPAVLGLRSQTSFLWLLHPPQTVPRPPLRCSSHCFP